MERAIEISDGDRNQQHFGRIFLLNTSCVIAWSKKSVRILQVPGLDSKSKDKGSDIKDSCYQEIPEKPKVLGVSCVHIHTLGFHFRNSNHCTMVANNVNVADLQ